MDSIKKVGSLIKYSIIRPPDVEIDGFFREAVEGKWELEDILMAWSELSEFSNVVLLPIARYKSQFDTMQNDIPYIYPEIAGTEIIFLVEDDRIDIKDIKNAEELSGAGKVLVPFNLKFENFPEKYTLSNNTEFFKLDSNQILLNNVKLILDDTGDQPGYNSGVKLTGRAAEIAAKKAQEDPNDN